eukprot:COSAG06_NODE_14908_length_1115_cov_1.397638_3_plen_44_part_01
MLVPGTPATSRASSTQRNAQRNTQHSTQRNPSATQPDHEQVLRG